MLATRRKDGRILISPVWHEWVDGGFVITTWANDVKSKNIKADPRITVMVAEHEVPYRSIEVSGEATIERLDEDNLGTLNSRQYAQIFYSTLESVIFPRFIELGLDPLKAWAERGVASS